MGPSSSRLLLVACPGLVADVITEILGDAGYHVEMGSEDVLDGGCTGRYGVAVVAIDGLASPMAILDGLEKAELRVLAMTENTGVAIVRELVLAGATSVCSFDRSPGMLQAAVALTAEGTSVLGHAAAGFIVREWRRYAGSQRSGAGPGLPDLTGREQDVLGALAAGLTTKAVARRLGVSLKTVESHKANIFKKLGVRTQAQAVSVAVEAGWVDYDTHAPAPIVLPPLSSATGPG